jgi:hypothetical protein
VVSGGVIDDAIQGAIVKDPGASVVVAVVVAAAVAMHARLLVDSLMKMVLMMPSTEHLDASLNFVGGGEMRTSYGV